MGMLMMSIVHIQLFNITSIFIEPISEDFGVPRAVFSVHYTVGTIVCIITSALIMKVIGRLGLRKMMLSSTVLAAVCNLLYSFAAGVWQFYCVSAVFGYCVITLGTTGVSIIINEQFPEKYRGRALGIAMCGSGMGGLIFSPIVGRINSVYGWRWSYRMFAVLIAALLLPLALKYARDTELAEETEKDGKKALLPYLRRREFWLVLVIIVLLGFAGTMLSSAGHAYFCEIGFDQATASLLLSMMFGSLLFGKLFLGEMSDRFGNRRVMLGAYILQVVSYILAVAMKKYMLLAFAAVLIYGIANAANTVCAPQLITDIFGAENYRIVGGALFSAVFAGSSLCPVFVSWIYDSTGSYVLSQTISLVLSVVTVLLLLVAYRGRKDAAG